MSDDEGFAIPRADCPAIVFGEEYYTVPQYAADAGVLLSNTEDYPDPFVRSLRKAAVQVLKALEQAYILADVEAPADLADNPYIDGVRTIGEDARIISVSPVPEGQGFPGSSITVMTTQPEAEVDVVGVNPANVRKWAHNNGYEVSDRGRIPGHVVDAYVEASGL